MTIWKNGKALSNFKLSFHFGGKVIGVLGRSKLLGTRFPVRNGLTTVRIITNSCAYNITNEMVFDQKRRSLCLRQKSEFNSWFDHSVTCYLFICGTSL